MSSGQRPSDATRVAQMGVPPSAHTQGYEGQARAFCDAWITEQDDEESLNEAVWELESMMARAYADGWRQRRERATGVGTGVASAWDAMKRTARYGTFDGEGEAIVTVRLDAFRSVDAALDCAGEQKDLTAEDDKVCKVDLNASAPRQAGTFKRWRDLDHRGAQERVLNTYGETFAKLAENAPEVPKTETQANNATSPTEGETLCKSSSAPTPATPTTRDASSPLTEAGSSSFATTEATCTSESVDRAAPSSPSSCDTGPDVRAEAIDECIKVLQGMLEDSWWTESNAPVDLHRYIARGKGRGFCEAIKAFQALKQRPANRSPDCLSTSAKTQGNL